MKLSIIFAIVAILVSGLAFAQETPAKYSMIELEISQANAEQILKLGLPLDCSFCAPADAPDTLVFHVPLTEPDIALLDQCGISYRVIVEDVAAFYEQRALHEDEAKAEAARENAQTRMDYGTMGGHYKLEEILSTMDSLYNKHKGQKLISAKWSIGKSYEGRDIYAIKISDNVDVDESGEAQVLYTALIHAREPAGMMTVFYFMHYLLENYATDQRVKNIVDNCELYFIPCVNPDGYGYNQKSKPTGGGMWRKNRNGSGIDLNRNWGPYDLWNYPNNGSSTSPSSETYRGTAPFSEPETAAVSKFVSGKKIRTALNYHTYSNLLIYPWGHTGQMADPKFKTMAAEMTRINGYRYGTAQQLLYAVRGDSDSWFFKDAGVFAMTPEVGGGGDGFWPSKSRIFPLAQENLEANLLLAEYATK